MAMTTRCPQCGTAFRVVPDQLRVRDGLVRCGECATVFDGRACLTARIPDGFGPPPVASNPVSAPMEPRAATPRQTIPAREPEQRPQPGMTAIAAPAVLRNRSHFSRQDPYLGEPPVRDTFVAGARSSIEASTLAELDDDPPIYGPARPFDEDDDDENAIAPDREDNSPVFVGEARTRYHGAADVGRAPPEFLDTEEHARGAFWRSLWGYGCLLGLLLLAAQAIYVYRTAIADMAPTLRPALERACASLGCEVGYARHIDRIAITSSSLQPPAGQAGAADDARATRLILRTTLRNLYEHPQPWPALRLDLSDLSDTVVIRKIIPPEVYLTPEQAKRPFAAGAELRIEVPIEVEGPMVNGFQLHKFFP